MPEYKKRKPSTSLTQNITTWYETDQERLEAGRKERFLDKERKKLDQRILNSVDRGYKPIQGSEYGVLILKQSSRAAYESLYRALTNALVKKLPEYAGVVKDTSEALENEAIGEQAQKRVIMCDKNKSLEKVIKRLEQTKTSARKGTKKVELVLYT